NPRARQRRNGGGGTGRSRTAEDGTYRASVARPVHDRDVPQRADSAMKVWRLTQSAAGPVLIATEAPQPAARPGEVLIRVRAAGVTPTELQWYPTSYTKTGEPRTGAIPGHEFSGVIAAVGEAAAGFDEGDEVFGLNDWFADGASAEYCVTTPP